MEIWEGCESGCGLFQGTVNSQLSSIQAPGILIQPAKTSKKMYYFYKVIQKQIYNAHIFIQHAIVLPASSSSTTILPQAGATAVEAS
jgi:hypothetical protein